MRILLLFVTLALVGAGCAGTMTEERNVGGEGTATPPASGVVVDRSGQGLSRFPSELLERTDIEELDISNNQMTGALPAEIGQLSKLRVLDASDNAFTGIPAEIGQLSQLEVLDFSNNQLTGLPHELGNLKELKELDLSGNDVSAFDLEIILRSLSPDLTLRLE
jgi:Leucine-rich repeat (LRR) protein